MKKNARTMRANAEKAAIWYCHKIHKCVVTRRAVRAQWQAVDMFGADVVGKKKDGSHVYVQATAGQASAVTARRRKLEKIPWHKTDVVELVQLVNTEDPANARRKLYFFRVHVYDKKEWSTLDVAVPVPREWFKKYQEET